MAEDAWEQAFRVRAAEGVNVCVAEGVADNLHSHLRSNEWHGAL